MCDFYSYSCDSILPSLDSWAQFTVKNLTINLSPCKLCIKRINSATGKLPASTIKCTPVILITMNLPKVYLKKVRLMWGTYFPCKILINYIDKAQFCNFTVSQVCILLGWVFEKSHGQLALHNWLMQPYWVSWGEICLLFTVGAGILFIVIFHA